MRRILKVQRPITSSEASAMGMLLIYDRGKERMCQCEVPAVLALFKPGEAKIFCYGDIVNGKPVITGRAPWQEW